jgi:hypothetical protein
LKEGFGFKAVFGFFLSDVHLPKDADLALGSSGSFLDFIHQPWAVYGMNQMNVGEDGFDFVGLKVTDEMPSDICGELASFALEFQRMVFSKIPLSTIVKLPNFIHRPGFGNGDEGATGVIAQFVLKPVPRGGIRWRFLGWWHGLHGDKIKHPYLRLDVLA